MVHAPAGSPCHDSDPPRRTRKAGHRQMRLRDKSRFCTLCEEVGRVARATGGGRAAHPGDAVVLSGADYRPGWTRSQRCFTTSGARGRHRRFDDVVKRPEFHSVETARCNLGAPVLDLQLELPKQIEYMFATPVTRVWLPSAVRGAAERGRRVLRGGVEDCAEACR